MKLVETVSELKEAVKEGKIKTLGMTYTYSQESVLISRELALKLLSNK